MPSDLERLHGLNPGEIRLRRDHVVGHNTRRSGGTDVLIEELPELGVEEFRSREEWQLACRIAASKGLCKSELLPKFLLYVCERYLRGESQEITEQRIGTQIFNRAPNYNPGEDNIVRSYARLLRRRLDEYFEGEGRNEPMRMAIPRGGYIPTFPSGTAVPEAISKGPRQEVADVDEMLSVPQAAIEVPRARIKERGRASERASRFSWPSIFLGVGLGLLIAMAGWAGIHSMRAEKKQEAAHEVWEQLFQTNRNTLIVPSDSGLGILENLSGHLVNLGEYASGAYLSEMKPPAGMDQDNFNDLRRQRYTSVVALDITSMLTQLPEYIANRSQVRYARNITTEDIKHANVILIGSKHTNPWVSLFERRLNFKLEYTPEVDQSFVVNERPTDAEQKVYRNGTDATANSTYGAIAYLPSLDGVGHVLIIQGLNMAATQAAAETLFNAKAMKPILQQASLPNGQLKSFELLIETSSINATAPGSQIIATRFYP
jgi:hypothetical protein